MTEQEILARTAYGENRGGGEAGMQSVLNVIMNRAAKPGWWGKTPAGVCVMPKQFDCWMPNDPNYAIIMSITGSDPVYAFAMSLASSALAGTLQDITNGATYYFADSMPEYPSWALGHIPCARIAGQLFFNDIT